MMTMTTALFAIGMTLLVGAVLVIVFVVFRPANGSVALSRRRPFGGPERSPLTKLADSTVGAVERVLAGNGKSRGERATLDQAGLKMARADFTVLVGAVAVVAGFVGLILQGPVFAVLFAGLTPVLAAMYLSFLTQRRRGQFEAQLGDTLTMVSGGLRAGHSVLRAIDAVAQEASEPTATEFARVVNETRLGRDLQESLNDVSLRMKSEDFNWMAQAIEINREVGGDLAQVFDQVGETIRERSQIKGMVKALASEGKLSAVILMSLPVLLLVLMGLVNPKYIGSLTGHPIGWVLMGVAVVMMTIGGLWIRKISDLKF
ncbi:type II secretion system F family protein [Arthrobacter oryzae]|uniref:type II secretion system F family protein n=1 Tax=Arthrobacter oryzae TaxID=409290 RepID=UPI00278336BE|nr:type II secretion system F family protein [Arthrobacter oryzae]MDQ0075011.1 tight adherence protein B [Arthrobacter oryzae]